MRALSVAMSLFTALSSVLLASCEQSQAPGGVNIPLEPGVSLVLAKHRAAILSNIKYTLHFEIPRDSTREIRAHSRIDFDLSDASAPLQLDFREQESHLHRVKSNGQDSHYQFSAEHIVVPAAELKKGPNTIEIEFTAGEAALNRNPEYLYTLFVPDRARTAFPLFDQPDLKAIYQLSLDLPTEWVGLANSAPETVDRGHERVLYRFAPTELLSSYLFSFVAGKFQSITAQREGRTMTLLHRETDEAKVARNIDRVFDLHADAIQWMEHYTGTPYPYQKFDFALIPAFQFGGMEHVGAVLYKASSLFLEESPSDQQRLNRARLIAHETAHMWFGNLVTMRWFNDVWTKEVFANFMAAKIINPGFPTIDHELAFLLDHYPAAYAVDRTPGANPIRQLLENLSDAGQMYGSIIYHKAPIMMRQLEQLIGEAALQQGLSEYLKSHAFANATWPDLIDILDEKTDTDLKVWSQVWVNSPGRPEYRSPANSEGHAALQQFDPTGEGKLWPQTLSGGMGYGLFPADLSELARWDELQPMEKGTLLINLYENLLAGTLKDSEHYYIALLGLIPRENNQLLIGQILGQVSRINVTLLGPAQRERHQRRLETALWQAVLNSDEGSKSKTFFGSFAALATNPAEIEKIRLIWSGELENEQLKLAETDFIELAEILAIRLPDKAEQIIASQLARTNNPDNRRRLAYIAPALAAQADQRDAFFDSLARQSNRQTESWVLDAMGRLHHPSRIVEAQKYLLPSLELLEEIQVTGDIFFPARWVGVTLGNHNSGAAIETVQGFLQAHPDYSPQLRMKILQALDLPVRANAILQAQDDHLQP